MRWLLLTLCLASCTRNASPPPQSPIVFRDVAKETGLAFTHHSGASGRFEMPEIMGAGAALFDYDSDGDLDVYLVQSHSGTSRLFRNNLKPSGKLNFTDATEETGTASAGYGMGAAVADINRDGKLDLLVTKFGQSTLYVNQGARFIQQPIGSPNQWASSASFFDYDRDGWPDLMLLSYVDFRSASNIACKTPAGEPDYCTPKAYRPVAAVLYRNDKGRFVDVTAKAGIDKALGPGLGVVAIDANNDSYLDLFVANDSERNHLWLNAKDGSFREAGLEAGLAYGEDGLAKAGMGVAAGDYDNDGDEDLIVLNLMREGATLFRNDGKGSYTDVSKPSKVHAHTFLFTGFGVGWADFDNDGWLDLFMANGAVTLRSEQRGANKPFAERKLLLRNRGDGTFDDVSATAGPAFQQAEVSRGAAFGDLDNDGRIDVLVTNNDGPPRLLLNESKAGAFHREEKLMPGVAVTLHRKGRPALTRVSRTDSSYASASDGRVHFGLGVSTKIERVEKR